jgi:hypothetical protein
MLRYIAEDRTIQPATGLLSEPNVSISDPHTLQEATVTTVYI